MSKAPQINLRFSNDSGLSRGRSLRFKNKPTPDESTKLETKNLDALLSAVNSSSQHVRKFHIFFLLAGVYIAIIIWSTTDMILLKETPVNLPLLNAGLPVIGFYRFAPFFCLLMHFNLLLQLSLLSDKLHAYNAALSKLADNEVRKYYDTRLFPFVFSHALSGTQHSGFLKFLLTVMVWVTMIWLPLCLLIGLQVGFLPYHSEQILELQRWAIVADLLIITIFWPIIRAPDGKWLRYVMWASGVSTLLSRIKRLFFFNTGGKQQGFLSAFIQWFKPKPSGLAMVEGSLSLITLTVVYGFSYGVAVLPDSDNEAWVAKKVSNAAQWLDNAYEIVGLGGADEKGENPVKFVDAWLSLQPLNKNGEPYFRLTEWLFDRKYLPKKDDKGNIQPGKWDTKQARDSIFHRNLRLREKLLIANELEPEDIAALMYDDEIAQEKMDDFENKRKIAINKTVGLSLWGRDLRYADFTGSLMPNVDLQPVFGKVDSQKGNDVTTNLSYAKFYRAKLFKARMIAAQLKDANLNSAQLQGADLRMAQFQGADLREAQLQGTDLREAQLQGADLMAAQLQGADLGMAQLQGTYLRDAQLQGADLRKSQLQGADLRSAQLQGADLRGAQLQDAYLAYAQLQGTDLSDAQLQGARLNFALLTLSNITGATFGKITEPYKRDLLERLSGSIKNPEIENKIKKIFLKAIKNSVLLSQAQGQNIWHDEGSQSEIVQKAFQEAKGGLEFAKSVSDYQNGLTEFLIELSCKDKWAASRFVRYRFNYMPMLLKTSFAKCLLYLKDKKNKSGSAVCPDLSEISKEDIEKLKKLASKKEPENNTQSTFTCEDVSVLQLREDGSVLPLREDDSNLELRNESEHQS
jgi:uncharacterized protein YjbI with pentapeptide repeats